MAWRQFSQMPKRPSSMRRRAASRWASSNSGSSLRSGPKRASTARLDNRRVRALSSLGVSPMMQAHQQDSRREAAHVAGARNATIARRTRSGVPLQAAAASDGRGGWPRKQPRGTEFPRFQTGSVAFGNGQPGAEAARNAFMPPRLEPERAGPGAEGGSARGRPRTA